jgi:hypothetical protein
MNELRHDAVFARLVGCALLVGCLFSTARAEVGIALRDDGFPVGYVMKAIVDDPEPVGIVWQRFSAESPARKILNDQGLANGDGRPSLATAPGSSVPMVAWSRNTPQGFDVVISRFVAGGWETPQIVAGSSGDELDPTLLVDPVDGSVRVVYWVGGPASRVAFRQAPADLSSWSSETVLSQPGEVACRPSATLDAGSLLVAYEVHDFGYGATPRRIVLARQDSAGTVWESLAVSQHPGDNWPQVHSAASVVWVDWIDAEGEMGWMRQPELDPWEPVQIETFAGPVERDFHVRGAIRLQATQ